MAEESLHGRESPFNQSSFSTRALFQLSQRAENIETVMMLLAKMEALLAESLESALSNITRSQRHHYLAALLELTQAARDQLDDVLCVLRPETNKD